MMIENQNLPRKRHFGNKFVNFITKPQNIILLIFGVVLTITTLTPIFAIIKDTLTIHAGSQTQSITGAKAGSFTFANWKILFTSELAVRNLWRPLLNTTLLAVLACFTAIVFGGVFAYFIARTNMKYKKYLSAVFIFPYIMPQWTLAIIWRNVFNSNAITGGSDGLFTQLTGINMPLWFAQGLFPSVIILAIHYAAFAYLLISGVFMNMDSNLEEAATILNTKKIKTFFRITLPLLRPAILSTVLLVFGSAVGSYQVPHYLNYTTLSTTYVEISVNYAGQASIIGIIMMLFGIAVLIVNRFSMKSRKNYTTVSGKSGQISKINLGKVGKRLVGIYFIIITAFTSIFPILLFAFETFLPNPGDYSFLKTGNFKKDLTLLWWTAKDRPDVTFSNNGILYNKEFWVSIKGTMIVGISAALIAGTIGLLIGYAVSKRRRSKFANYVNDIAFIPYLLPSLAVGIAFFILGSALGIHDTYFLIILVGVVKYIPFASRSSLNAMLQISGEIEESAIIMGTPWWKRMFYIIIPIQRGAIISGYLLPFMTAVRELTLFMLLCTQGKIATTMISYFDEMGLPAFSSAINFVIIIIVLVVNFIVNKLTKSGLASGIGGAQNA